MPRGTSAARRSGSRYGERPPLEFAGYWLYAGGVPCVHVADRGEYTAHSERLGRQASAAAVDHVAFNGEDYAELAGRLERGGVDAMENEIPRGDAAAVPDRPQRADDRDQRTFRPEGAGVNVELANAYWTSAGPGRGARRAGVEPLPLRGPLRRGGEGRLQGHRAVARGRRAPARVEHARRHAQGARRRRHRVHGARVPVGLDGRRRRGGAHRGGQAPRRCCSRPAEVLGAHHIKAGNIPGVECEMPKLNERYAELCADAAAAHLGEGALRVHALRREREQHRLGARR